MKVKGAVARSQGAPLRIESLELDEPRDDEVLVKLIASGVASADLDAIDGRLAMPMPFVPGCEGAGIVERIGAEVRHVAPGDSVVVTLASCGCCEACASGRPFACADFGALNLAGRRLDGTSTIFGDDGRVNGGFFGQSSFATHLLCRDASAIKVATGAPLEVLAGLGGEVLRGAGVVLHGFRPRPDDALLVTGGGAAALAAVMAAKSCGVRTIVLADGDGRQRHLASEVGAAITVHPDGGLVDLVRSVAADGVRFAFDTTGTAAMRAACFESLTRGGTCALLDAGVDAAVDREDQIAEGAALLLSADAHVAPAELVPRLVDLHARGAFPLERLIDFFPFEHVGDALDALRRGTVAKPVVRFSLGAFADLDRAKVEGAADEQPGDAPTDPVDAPAPTLVKS